MLCWLDTSTAEFGIRELSPLNFGISTLLSEYKGFRDRFTLFFKCVYLSFDPSPQLIFPDFFLRSDSSEGVIWDEELGVRNCSFDGLAKRSYSMRLDLPSLVFLPLSLYILAS